MHGSRCLERHGLVSTPLWAETVNYVIQRGDLYCAFGCVAALYFFARFKRQRRTGLYLLPLVFALLAKPPAAVFPALLFLYVFFFEAEGKSSRAAHSLLAAFPAMTLTALLLWLQSAMTPHTFLAVHHLSLGLSPHAALRLAPLHARSHPAVPTSTLTATLRP